MMKSNTKENTINTIKALQKTNKEAMAFSDSEMSVADQPNAGMEVTDKKASFYFCDLTGVKTIVQ